MNTEVISRIVGPISLPCLVLGVFFFAASLTPSLIPRGPMVQGILGGLVTALGYLVGQVVGLLWRTADMPRLTGRPARILTWSVGAGTLALFLWVLGTTLTWQNDLRGKMGMDSADALHLWQILFVALAVFAAAFALGRLLASLFRLVRARFYRVMPPRRANVLGLIAVFVLLFFVTRDGILDRVVTGLDESYEAAQVLFENAPPPPSDPRMTGSAESMIDWDAIGKPGRDFITSGPDAAVISAFNGRPAKDPIRVYVGRANGETPRARAELALAELKRQGAFDRAVLVVASPTGTGWMDPGSHDPVEYIHDGDIATVAAQYSYLQSPLALILETETGLEQATALQDVVHGYWKTLPADARPRFYVHGLSLGAWSSMHATNLFRLMDDPIDGAFWAGPPFPSAFWNYVQRQKKTIQPLGPARNRRRVAGAICLTHSGRVGGRGQLGAHAHRLPAIFQRPGRVLRPLFALACAALDARPACRGHDRTFCLRAGGDPIPACAGHGLVFRVPARARPRLLCAGLHRSLGRGDRAARLDASGYGTSESPLRQRIPERVFERIALTPRGSTSVKGQ